LGSGKTSLINLVRERLAMTPELPVLDFNPWMLSGAEQLVDSFFAELAAQLRLKGGRFQRIAERLDSYGELLTPLSLLPVVGAWTERLRGTTGALKRYQDKRKHGVSERRQQLVDELVGLEQPIVVVLDDIDRLTTGEIRETFKLVRLTASFPNIIYLLAFDRRRVEQALSEEGIDGRDYLEKIVQAVVDIPAIPRDLLLQTLGSALTDVVNAATAAQRFDSDRWPDLLFEVIWPQITTMRDVRRLAASVYAAVRGLRDEVELVDVLALEAIRVFMPDTFAVISAGEEGLTTTNGFGLGQHQDSPAYKVEVEAVVAAATREGSADAAKAIIERLFPAATRHISNTNYGSDWEKQWLRARRVAHKDVLKLYLERNASENLAAFRDAERVLAVAHDEQRLDDYFRALQPERWEKVITALEVYEGELPHDSITPLSTVLLNLMPSIPDRPRGMLDLMEPRIVVARVVLRALRQLATPEAVHVTVDEILPKLQQLSSQAELVQLVGHQEGAGHKLVSEEVAAAYEEALARSVEDVPAEDLVTERDLLRLLLAAERTTGRSPLRALRTST
jgi:predicted KAP-like P-loop ATPase